MYEGRSATFANEQKKNRRMRLDDIPLLTCGTEGHLLPSTIAVIHRSSKQGQRWKLLKVYGRPKKKRSRKTHTIGHAQARVVQRLPIRERLAHCTVTIIIDRIRVVLEEVADEELGLALRPQEKPQAKTVEDAPSGCVRKV